MVYFQKVDEDPDGKQSLDEWLRVKDALLAGKPRPPLDGAEDRLTVAELCDRFLKHKRHLRDTGELAPRSFEEYHRTCDRIVRVFRKSRLVEELTAEDFGKLRRDMAKTYGLVRIANEIQRSRSVFKFGLDEGLIDRPIRYGQSFAKPSQKSLRVTRASKGPRMFTAEQIRKILDVATVNIRAMVLLAINAAVGNTDVAELPTAAVDLEAGWLVYPRVKTGIPRRVPLWPETLAAIREVLAHRKPANTPEDERLLFIGKRGESYVGKHRGYRVHQEFIRVLKLAGIEGRTFYDLRRTFETVAEDSKDLSAVQAVMGHSPPANDMSAVYRQKVDDGRLHGVVDVVRRWLFAGAELTPEHAEANQKQAGADPLAVAIGKALLAIENAEGPTRRTLESVWLPEIRNATEFPRGSGAARLVEVWYQRPDDPVAAATNAPTNGERPTFRVYAG